MSVVLSIVGWALIALLVLLLLLVVVPIHLELEGIADDDVLEGSARVRWGYRVLVLRADSVTGIDARLLGLRVWRHRPGDESDEDDADGALSAWRRRRKEKKALKAAEKTARPSKRRKRRASLWTMVRTGMRLMGAIAGAVPVRGYIAGTLGGTDPAETGALFAVLDRIAERSHAIELDLVPNWIDEEMAVEGAIGVRLWPAHILLALCWLLIRDGQTRRGVGAMLRAR